MFTKCCALLARICLKTAVGGLIAIILCVLLQVFGRYVLNDTPTWAEALAMLLVLYVTMLGASVGVRDAGHIGMESLLVLVAAPVREKIELVIHVLVTGFGAAMAWNGAYLAYSVMDYNIPTLSISEGFKHLPLVLAGVLITLFSIEHIIAQLQGKAVAPAWH